MNIFELLKITAEKDATDLHITAGSPPMIRTRGDLIPLDHHRLAPEDTKEMVMSILSGKQKALFESNRSIDLAYSLNSNNRETRRFRINAFYQKGMISAAFRKLSDEILPVEKLHLPASLNKLTDFIDGLVLITGQPVPANPRPSRHL